MHIEVAEAVPPQSARRSTAIQPRRRQGGRHQGVHREKSGINSAEQLDAELDNYMQVDA
jgi:C-terminal duplication domain of Friend of PRMT1